MIFIDLSRLVIPPEWAERARQASIALKELPDDERPDFINSRSAIWHALKHELAHVSCDKCWYCEAKDIRADLHVDHHRPKNSVANDDRTKGPGYWFLAFDASNFRLACSYCNCLHTDKDGITRGKSDQFPLASGSIRASNESELVSEMPLLLDPTNRTDPSLLWFNDDGSACSKDADESSFFFKRANATIQVLNLNDVRIKEARRALFNRCRSLIRRGDEAYIEYRNGDPRGRARYEGVVAEICELVQSSSEFSAAALAYFSGSFDWVRGTIR